MKASEFITEGASMMPYFKDPKDEKQMTWTFPTAWSKDCLLYTSPSPRDQRGSRMPSSA